jgi:hypothetical protein
VLPSPYPSFCFTVRLKYTVFFFFFFACLLAQSICTKTLYRYRRKSNGHSCSCHYNINRADKASSASNVFVFLDIKHT